MSVEDPPSWPPTEAGVDARDVISGYEMFFGRSPESAAAIRAHLSYRNRIALGQAFIRSDEFLRRLLFLGLVTERDITRLQPDGVPAPSHIFTGCTDSDLDIFEAFPVTAIPAMQGFLIDFLGNRTRASYSPAFAEISGRCYGHPIPSDFIAEAVEWVGVIKAVLSAPGPSWTVLELGAGWAPWLVATATMAQRRGLFDIRLHGIEANPVIAPMAAQHFTDNGLDPGQHVLMQGAVGTSPNHSMPVPVFAFADLLQRQEVWDLVHMDVQGVEFEICQHAANLLDRSVRWLVIGTSSRKIDGDLIDLLHRRGWMLEHEKPTRFSYDLMQRELRQMGTADGTQVWRNPRHAPAFDASYLSALRTG